VGVWDIVKMEMILSVAHGGKQVHDRSLPQVDENRFEEVKIHLSTSLLLYVQEVQKNVHLTSVSDAIHLIIREHAEIALESLREGTLTTVKDGTDKEVIVLLSQSRLLYVMEVQRSKMATSISDAITVIISDHRQRALERYIGKPTHIERQ
jgi:hypothetical protein